MGSDRARGVLLRLACEDALGRPVEFLSALEITAEYGRLDEMVGYGPWNHRLPRHSLRPREQCFKIKAVYLDTEFSDGRCLTLLHAHNLAYVMPIIGY